MIMRVKTNIKVTSQYTEEKELFTISHVRTVTMCTCVGEMGQRLHMRLTEHKWQCRFGQQDNSAIDKHSIKDTTPSMLKTV